MGCGKPNAVTIRLPVIARRYIYQSAPPTRSRTSDARIKQGRAETDTCDLYCSQYLTPLLSFFFARPSDCFLSGPSGRSAAMGGRGYVHADLDAPGHRTRLGHVPSRGWANWPKTIADYLQLPSELVLFAGMSLGYEDASAPINEFRTDREAFENFAQMIGF
jgi:hypothetical protein